ncbi:MAG: prmC [Bacteriovoracaceae bacterium]|nr:prmC [Bacteriovoracaceae bacterium]
MESSLEKFSDFLNRHHAVEKRIDDPDSSSDFFAEALKLPEIVGFTALADTLAYARLLTELLRITAGANSRRLIDLGIGSAIPSIIALRDNPQNLDLKVIGIDTDAAALQTASENAETFGVSRRFQFYQGDFLKVMDDLVLDSKTLIGSNPPYLPVPESVKNSKFSSINGGTDGTFYLKKILQHPFPSGSVLALAWSSLSNPAVIISLMEKNYEILYVHSYIAKFGVYTKSNELAPHLEAERNADRCLYFTGNDGIHRQWILGTILRRL